MQIIIFENSSRLVTGFRDFGIEPMIDAVHGSDKNWLLAKLQCPHRLFWLDLEKNQIVAECIDTLEQNPSFVIYFNHDQMVTQFEWDQIIKFVNCIFLNQPITGRTERCIQRLKTQMVTQTPQQTPPDLTQGLPQYYQFRSVIHEPSDTGFFEIIKANSDIPYTTIISQFTQKGYKPLFTNYFTVNVFKNDCIAIHFLSKLWERFMEGPFDLDTLLKEATEQCYPAENFIPNAEPRVYARTIEQVMENRVYRSQ